MFTRQWLVDVVERVLATFVATFVAALVLAGVDVLSLSSLKSAAVAGLAAVLSLVKGLLAPMIGTPSSASLVPSVGHSSVSPGEDVPVTLNLRLVGVTIEPQQAEKDPGPANKPAKATKADSKKAPAPKPRR